MRISCYYRNDDISERVNLSRADALLLKKNNRPILTNQQRESDRAEHSNKPHDKHSFILFVCAHKVCRDVGDVSVNDK